MDVAAIIRKYGATVVGGLGVALWLVALYLLASAAQNSAEFDRWLPWILLINISGLLTLLVLLAAKLSRLVRDYRRHVPGSRLKGRTVAIFSALAVAEISFCPVTTATCPASAPFNSPMPASLAAI